MLTLDMDGANSIMLRGDGNAGASGAFGPAMHLLAWLTCSGAVDASHEEQCDVIVSQALNCLLGCPRPLCLFTPPTAWHYHCSAANSPLFLSTTISTLPPRTPHSHPSPNPAFLRPHLGIDGHAETRPRAGLTVPVCQVSLTCSRERTEDNRLTDPNCPGSKMRGRCRYDDRGRGAVPVMTVCWEVGRSAPYVAGWWLNAEGAATLRELDKRIVLGKLRTIVRL